MDPFLQEMSTRDWYIQGFAGRPAFLMIVPSIELMERETGFTYQAFCASYKSDYCEYRYWNDDLVRLGKFIENAIEKDPTYLNQKRKLNQGQVEKLQKGFTEIRKGLENVSDEQLMEWIQWGEMALEHVVGCAHMLEGVPFALETKIRERLEQNEHGKQLNEDFSILTSPVTPSFLSQRDHALWEINQAEGKEKDILIEKFMETFYWVNTSYVGNIPWTKETVMQVANEVVQPKTMDFEQLKADKEKLYTKYHLSKKEIEWTHMIEFSTDWQDERKKNIYHAICAMDAILHEASRRFNLNVKYLHFMLPHEITLQGLKDGSIERLGKERYHGSVFVKTPGKYTIYSGKEATEFEELERTKHEHMEIVTGNAASLGTATGPVKICTNIESLDKVQPGDILVASMTRPEYISAMKKAAAIVTDEGGITCHAAIVSRELGIPCVIGTKVATKVLKDGWIVQVKASHGNVTVLQKKSLAVSHPQK